MDRIFVGIDAGVSAGLAVWNSTRKQFILLETLAFWDLMGKIGGVYSYCKKKGFSITIVIEDVTQNSPTFNRGEFSQAINNNISQKVGSVKRDTTLIIQWCERKGMQVIRERPTRKSETKLKHEEFVERTKWRGKRVSQHARDAGMLVYNK